MPEVYQLSFFLSDKLLACLFSGEFRGVAELGQVRRSVHHYGLGILSYGARFLFYGEGESFEIVSYLLLMR